MSDETNDTAEGDEAEAPEAEPAEAEAEEAGDDAPDAAADEAGGDEPDAEATATTPEEGATKPATKPAAKDAAADRKAKADAVIAQRTVQRRTVTSRRVTPKAGDKAAAKAPADAPKVISKARDARKTEVVARTVTPPSASYERGPSPWWVPAIMFGLLILGALVIMANYIGVFGDPSNLYLVIGLGFILGGIVAATQYR